MFVHSGGLDIELDIAGRPNTDANIERDGVTVPTSNGGDDGLLPVRPELAIFQHQGCF